MAPSAFALLRRLGYEIRQCRRGLPTVASLDITERCRLRCRMCRFWLARRGDRTAELPTRVLCDLIDELADDLGVRRIRLLGGEPFVREDAIALARHAKGRGLHVNVVTDGTCIDPVLAEQIVDSGIDSIRFSIDGIGERHDRVRGCPGAYEKVTSALRWVREAKRRRGVTHPSIEVFSVVSSLNHDQILPLHELSRTEFAPCRYLFGPLWETTPRAVEGTTWEGRPLADGHHLPIGRSLRLTAEQQRVFERQVRRMRRGSAAAITGAVLRVVTRPFLGGTVCPEIGTVHVDPYGRVRFCGVLMDSAYGKYPETGMREIWGSPARLRFHQAIRRRLLPVCDAVCGDAAKYYVGTPVQMARQLLLRVLASPRVPGGGGARRDTAARA